MHALLKETPHVCKIASVAKRINPRPTAQSYPATGPPLEINGPSNGGRGIATLPSSGKPRQARQLITRGLRYKTVETSGGFKNEAAEGTGLDRYGREGLTN